MLTEKRVRDTPRKGEYQEQGQSEIVRLKRKYGGQKSHPRKSNSKNYEQSAYMRLIRLKFPAGCSEHPSR